MRFRFVKVVRRRSAAMIAAAVGLVAASGGAPDAAREPVFELTHSGESTLRLLDDGVIDTPYEVKALAQTTRKVESLAGSRRNVKLVSKLGLEGGGAWAFSDVAVHGNFAYVGEFYGGCADDGRGGVHVVDISDPRRPVATGKVLSPPNTLVSEGVQVVPISTSFFTGDLLVHNNEPCSLDSPSSGGISLWDVTNPRLPLPLATGVGDVTPPTDARSHWTHSAFVWDAGDRAFAMLVDDEEAGLDVDILEITNPRAPVVIAETGLSLWPDAQDSQSNGTGTFGALSFHHDHVVKKIGERWYALVSYWDAGWVVLDVTNPLLPTFVDDTTYPDADPFTGATPAEGNAHQAEWNRTNEFFIGADEDFAPRRIEFRITTGDHTGTYPAAEMGWTAPVDELPDRTLNGPTVYGGYGCASDRERVPEAADVKAQLEVEGRPLQPGQELVLVLQRGPFNDPNEPPAEACIFAEKNDTTRVKGYDALIIANHHNGANFPGSPDTAPCYWSSQEVVEAHRGLCVGHRALHFMFARAESYAEPYPLGDPGDLEPNIGDIGEEIKAFGAFDGWGYIHLFDATTGEEIDTHSIAEGIDPDAADRNGILSVHEVAMDAVENVAYLAWYGGGFRVVRFNKAEGLVETGHYVDARGSNLWGVEAWRQPGTGRSYALASDTNLGLYIFEYTGPT